MPPKDSTLTSLVPEVGLKRNSTHRFKKLLATTNTSSKDLPQHQAYAESAQGHIFPEVAVKPDDYHHSSEKIPATTDQFSKDAYSQHQAYPESNYAEHNRGGALPQAVVELGNYPEVAYGNQPEALNRDHSAPEVAGQPKSTKTICGLRKMWFWTILAAVILVVLIAAVVGGVVGSRAANAEPQTKSILPTTALAAVNYTEANDIKHYRVYFQAESNALYQSAWNSSTQKWSVSPLNPQDKSGPEIKPGTPLAAYTLNDGVHVSPDPSVSADHSPALTKGRRAQSNTTSSSSTPKTASGNAPPTTRTTCGARSLTRP